MGHRRWQSVFRPNLNTIISAVQRDCESQSHHSMRRLGCNAQSLSLTASLSVSLSRFSCTFFPTTHTYTHTHTRTHTRTHARTHARAHTHAHTHTNTQALRGVFCIRSSWQNRVFACCAGSHFSLCETQSCMSFTSLNVPDAPGRYSQSRKTLEPDTTDRLSKWKLPTVHLRPLPLPLPLPPPTTPSSHPETHSPTAVHNSNTQKSIQLLVCKRPSVQAEIFRSSSPNVG